jgi:hypothetical protein
LTTTAAALNDDTSVARAIRKLAETDPLNFGAAPATTAGLIFQHEAPPSRSPGAVGTPPP